MKIANIKVRILAGIIDKHLWILLFTLPFLFLSFQADLSDLVKALILSLIYWLSIFFIYPLVQVYLISRFGGTVGKLATFLKVTDSDLKRVSFKTALKRNVFGYAVSTLFLGLGFWWIFRDKERQGWHDKIAGTKVYSHASGYLTGFLALGTILILLISTGVLVLNNVSRNSMFYTSLLTEITTGKNLDEGSEFFNISGNSVTVTSSAQKPFADANVLSVMTNASAISTELSNFPYGFWTEDKEWGLVNTKNEAVYLALIYKTPVEITSITNSFAPCEEDLCLLLGGTAVLEDNTTVELTPQTLSKGQTELTIELPTGKIMAVQFVIFGGSAESLRWQKIQTLYRL